MKRELEAARAAYERLGGIEDAEWDKVTNRHREKKLRPFLQSFALEFARIPGLGPAELGRLASRGIATAADITPEALMSMRFMDLELVKALLLFKGVATQAFRFDPVIGVPGRESKALEDAQALRRAKLVKQLQQGALELAEVRRQTLAWREVLGRGLQARRIELDELQSHAVWTHSRALPARPRRPLALAARAVVRRALADDDPPDPRAAARARLALAPVDAALVLVRARVAVGLHVVADAAAARRDRAPQHAPDGRAMRSDSSRVTRRPGRVAARRRGRAPRRRRCCRRRPAGPGRAAAP